MDYSAKYKGIFSRLNRNPVSSKVKDHESINKEMVDFYKNVDFTAHQPDKDDELESLAKNMEKLNIDHLPKLRDHAYLLFQNMSSLSDEIEFADFTGNRKPFHSKIKTIKSPKILKPDYNSQYDKAVFRSSFLNELVEIKEQFDMFDEFNADTNNAFDINLKFTIKIGNLYFFPNNELNIADPRTIEELIKAKRSVDLNNNETNAFLRSSFSDNSDIRDLARLYSCLTKTNFKKCENTISFKLILNNRDDLFKSIFENIKATDEYDELILKELINARSLDFKLDENLTLKRITVKEHSKLKSHSINFDLIIDPTKEPVFSSSIVNQLNLESTKVNSFKYDIRFQLKHALTIDEKSYKNFFLLQLAVERVIKFDRKYKNKLILKCKKHQFNYLRRKQTINYNNVLNNQLLKDYCIDFNILNYVEYYASKTDLEKQINADEIFLRESNTQCCLLSIASNLNEIVHKDDRKDTEVNELVDISWDLGLWLSNISSSCM